MSHVTGETQYIRASHVPRETPVPGAPQLRTECAWCSVVISDGVLPVSHGICPRCDEIVFGAAL